MTLYDKFIRKRIDNNLSELIQIDLNTDSSKKNEKKKNLNLFLQNRNRIFIKMKEKQIMPRHTSLQSNIIPNIAIKNVSVVNVVI